MIDIPERPADVTVSMGAWGLAQAVDDHDVTVAADKREPLARAVLEAAWPYLDGVGPATQP
ncbi:hypothetical protein WEI85_15880 [Actinomycetes bacterium KLBMP 9797]